MVKHLQQIYALRHYKSIGSNIIKDDEGVL